jgi:hypothetical protein
MTFRAPEEKIGRERITGKAERKSQNEEVRMQK